MKLKYLVGVMLTMFILSSCDDTTNEIGTSLIHDMDNLDVTTDPAPPTAISAPFVIPRRAMSSRATS